jgi:hypothetical protein
LGAASSTINGSPAEKKGVWKISNAIPGILFYLSTSKRKRESPVCSVW